MPASSQPRIIILTGASYPWCNRVKDYLKEKRFRFKEVNVEKDLREPESSSAEI